ncbi:MAG: hypothetical protein SGPRY_011758 [Prymnesium sp.]
MGSCTSCFPKLAGFTRVVGTMGRTRSSADFGVIPEKRALRRIDRRWARDLADRLISEPLLWTSAGCALYSAPDLRPQSLDKVQILFWIP